MQFEALFDQGRRDELENPKTPRFLDILKFVMDLAEQFAQGPEHIEKNGLDYTANPFNGNHGHYSDLERQLFQPVVALHELNAAAVTHRIAIWLGMQQGYNMALREYALTIAIGEKRLAEHHWPPADGTQELKDQLRKIADQLNTLLENS